MMNHPSREKQPNESWGQHNALNTDHLNAWANYVWSIQSSDYALKVAELNEIEKATELAGGPLSPFSAFAHFISGTGTDIKVAFRNAIETINKNDLDPIQELISEKFVGKTHLNEKFNFNTADSSLITGAYLGNILMNIQGDFIRSANGAWTFDGTISAERDLYDADANPDRTFLANRSTDILSIFDGKPYWIDIYGSPHITISNKGGDWFGVP